MLDPDRLEALLVRHDELNAEMATPEVATDMARMVALGREIASLRDVVPAIERYQRLLREQEELRVLIETEPGEMAELAELELAELEERMPQLEAELQQALIPKDPEDARDAIVEIRAGTGGDEAALFAGDLFDVYSRFAVRHGWRVEIMDTSHGAAGGYKEVVFALKGADAFGTMKYESGVHRVQRVPATESQGRIHTSAATVAVLPEAEEVDVELRQQDIEVDVYRSSGPGGQSVNTTDSAVRLTHKPSGLVVTCQDEKSQLKNKEKAMRVLRSRLYQLERDRVDSERADARRSMVGSGDRSAKIRTYNWPQARVTDHRLEGDDKNRPLQAILSGDLDPIVQALRVADNAERLAGGE
jgi:peptide chain release factor 1